MRVAYVVTAIVAWLGVVITVALSGLGAFEETPVDPGLYGLHPDGAAGVLSRLSDTASYFTNWSNVAVAVAVTLIALHPGRSSGLTRGLWHTSLLMITITAVVYAVLLAPTDTVVGWAQLTNPIKHIVTPALAVLVWLVFGPRGRLSWRTTLAATLLPLAWIMWMLGRGVLVQAYPYGFVNVAVHGYGSVFRTVGAILVFGWVLAALMWGVDAILARVARRRVVTAADGAGRAGS